MSTPVAISLAALAISGAALYFTFKKDAHRVRLALTKVPEDNRDHLRINNDSSFPVRVCAVGRIERFGGVKWLKSFGNWEKNDTEPYPITVGARTTLRGFKVHGMHHPVDAYGYCVQLDCGRTFVAAGDLPLQVAYRFKAMAILSWLSSGRLGFPENTLRTSWP
jgi:hypothetical protein